MSSIEILTLLIYLSFAIDLLGFPVPSEASTLQLFFPKDQSSLRSKNNLLSRIQRMPLIFKIVLLLIPSLIAIGTYLLPLLVTLLPSLKPIFGQMPSPEFQIITIVGIGLAFLGRALSIRSAVEISAKSKKQKTDIDASEQTSNYNVPPKNLKTKRLFQMSRNPILLGLHLTFIGLALIFPVRAMFFGGLVYFTNMHFKVILEEHYLKEKYGASFLNYCQTTNRYL